MISFGSSFTEYNTKPFPIDDLVVSPYWDDIDLEITGEVRYSLLSDVESSLLQQVNYFLENNQSLEFNASWILIVQWIDTCPYENNTCQSEVVSIMMNKCAHHKAFSENCINISKQYNFNYIFKIFHYLTSYKHVLLENVFMQSVMTRLHSVVLIYVILCQSAVHTLFTQSIL